MLRTFRYPLEPTKAQAEVLTHWLAACCSLYNAALQERRDAWAKQHVTIGYNRQTASLALIRGDDPEWKGIPSNVARSALRRLDEAFKAFFRRCKSGEKPGYPRFRSRDRYDTMGLGLARIDGNHVMVPKLGPVKFRRYRELKGTVRSVQIRRGADRWWLCVSCDLGDAPAKVSVRTYTGIDVGLESFATLADGTTVENPRFFRQGEELLARRQQALATKKPGSNSRKSAKRLVAKAHEHIKNQRRDFAWKLANRLLEKFDLVSFEDLQIKRMVHGNLAKSIHDAAWGLFLHALACKAEEAGKWAMPVDPRGTSQRCSSCSTIVRKVIADRQHICCVCGLSIHRDHNAALNVVALGMSAVALAGAEVLH